MRPPPPRPAPPVGMESSDTLCGDGVVGFPLPVAALASPMKVEDAPGEVAPLPDASIPKVGTAIGVG